MTPKAHIAPSILSADLLQLGHELDDVRDADLIHFDVMDGVFVPQVSYGHPILKQVVAHTDVPVDVHLMVSNPDVAVPTYLDLHPAWLSFHLEVAYHAHRLVHAIQDAGVHPCVAINPGTPICMLEPVIEDVDMVLIMTVNPGFGGQSFIPQSIARLHEVRALCKRHGVSPLVEVDGGISAKNACEVAEAGADVFVAGSALFGQKDRAGYIAELRVEADAGIAKRA